MSSELEPADHRSSGSTRSASCSSSSVVCCSSSPLCRPRIVDLDVVERGACPDERTSELVRRPREREVEVVVAHLRPADRAEMRERFGQQRAGGPQERSLVGPEVDRQRAPHPRRRSIPPGRDPPLVRRESRDGSCVDSILPESAHPLDRSDDVRALHADAPRGGDEPSAAGAIREQPHERHVQMREAHLDHAPHGARGGLGSEERRGELEHRGHLADRAFALRLLPSALHPAGHRRRCRRRTRPRAGRATARWVG